MKQVAVATMWGITDGGHYTLEQLPGILDNLKRLGYGAIEMTIGHLMQVGSTKVEALLKERDVKLVAMVFSACPAPTPAFLGVKSEYGIVHPEDDKEDFHNVSAHKAVWRAQVEEAARLKDVLLAVTSHTGRDYFTPEETDDLFRYCIATEEEMGIMINHETHRARCLYSPWVMQRVLDAHPKLHLVADYSHFSAVAEMGAGNGLWGHYTKPLQAVIEACNVRVRHIHARVGFEEGPQIPDPRSAAWRPYFDGYMAWWAGIIKHAAARGQAILTTTPEFGPPAYAWTDPYNGDKPIVNVWDVNHWVGMQIRDAMAKDGHEAAPLVEDPDKGAWAM